MSVTAETAGWSTTAEPRPWITEDWLSVWIGLGIFALALGWLWGVDLLGWVVTTSVWIDPSQALGTFSKAYGQLGGPGALAVTYLALLAVLTAGARVLGLDLRRFAIAFTAVFAFAYASWIIGSYAYVAVVTPADQQKFGIGWSLKLTNEGGYVVALLLGLIIANFFPRLAEWLKEAIRPELYIKIAIVILGAFLAVTAAGRLTLATSLLWRGIAAIIEAYLIYWAVVYYIARKWFGFNREWAAPLASGISICGVSAAIAVGGAIRARPIVPVMVSSLVVIFAVVEVLILPFLAQSFLWQEPMVGRLDGPGGQDRRRRGCGRRYHRVADPGEGGGRGYPLSARLDSRRHRHGKSFHRYFHRYLGLRARLYLDQAHQSYAGWGAGGRNLAALPEIHYWLRPDLRGRPRSCARNADRNQF